jgi:hypothetical protein
MSNLITTDSEFLNDLDYSNLNTADQAKVTALCSVATQLIQKECNRIFGAASYVELLDGLGNDSIFIKNPPINTLTDITIISSEETVYDDSVFDFDAGTGEIWWDSRDVVDASQNYLGCFPCGRRNIQVTYNGGFEPVPPPIEMVAANLVMEMFDPSLATSENMEMEKLGQYQYKRRKDAADKSIHTNRKILHLYKIRRVY